LCKPDLEDETFAALAADTLLQALLCRTPNQDRKLESLLTAARQRLLQTVQQSASIDLAFVCAMARQCFINEYVFAQGVKETERACRLRDELAAALEQGAVLDPVLIGVVAAYFPLLSVPLAPRLLERSWPAEIEAVLTQQIREPGQEDTLRAAIPRLTVIKDDVSHLVRSQYEENPYPRWVSAGPAVTPQSLASFLRQTSPFVPVEDQSDSQDLDILVAGCGTGRNAIETRQKFAGAQVLAVDLSRNSLAHAARKTQELGISGIDYAQADILELGATGRRFDLIEAVGVLHHLADPFAGWHVLASLLKPRGVMMVGLYSSEARRDLPAMAFGLGDTAQGVRQARQILIGQNAPVIQRVDFFTTSTCRDLLFHVQEHRLTLAEIAGFLAANNLRLLGFSLEDAVLAAYRKRFADDPGAVNLDHWQAFEKDHPETFSGMYQFWLQKAE
jgi:2-polyprenyl-3-methyl-5-hydroxy-6-metoxy-1,4-benzoquinol methylase